MHTCIPSIQNLKSKPSEITEFSDSAMMIVWDDGHESIYLYEELRQACPCARCNEIRKSTKKGNSPFKRPILLETKTPNLKPKAIEHVGLYAIRFAWNDGHDTGIYTFDLLRKLCTCEECQSNQ